MFYRRKILLTLIEVFGRKLTKLDCQRLLLLFCKRAEKNYYDFFSSGSGIGSFILEQDKNRLTNLGFFAPQDDFQLNNNDSFLPYIKTKDRIILQSLIDDVKKIQGKTLRSKIYAIAESAEQEYIWQGRNTNTTPCLFTIGYEGLSIDAYLNLLLASNVLALIDVRKNPVSMKYGFSKSRLMEYTSDVGIRYFHMPELGIPSSLRRDLDSAASYRLLFEYYRSQILPEQFEAIEKLKNISREQGRVALTCFEADHQFCHRHKITEYLASESDFETLIVHLNKACIENSCVECTASELLLI